MNRQNEGQIVKRNLTGDIGILVWRPNPDGGAMVFYPANIGMYDPNLLPVVTEKDISGTSLEEKIIYLKIRNTWGKVKSTTIINEGEYIIMEVVHKPTEGLSRNILFHGYLNFKSISRCYESLDSAIIGILDYKYQGGNSQAGVLFERMLEMKSPVAETGQGKKL